jgi:hypothetical protein
MHLYSGHFLNIGNTCTLYTGYKVPDNFSDLDFMLDNGKSSVTIHANAHGVNMGNSYFSVRVNQVQGNCGMIYLDSLNVDNDYLDSSLEFLNFILEGMRSEGYSQVMYSATTSQIFTRKVLEKSGFILLPESEFRNRRSSNTIHMFIKNL